MPRQFPDWINGYLEYTLATEAPTEFHFWTAVSTIAGALRRNVWIDEDAFIWTPNFYIVLVGPAGVVTKSTTLDFGRRLLEKLPDVSFGPSSGSWQGLMKAFESAVMTVKWKEPSGKEHIDAASPLTVMAGELGTFLKLEQEGFIEVLIDWWDGKKSGAAWSHITKASGNSTIERPWLNILGCTTLSWIQQNIQDVLIGGGFMSRVLFIYAGKKSKLIAYPSMLRKAGQFQELEDKLILDLKQIGTLRGPFSFTPEARQFGIAWHTQTMTVRPAHMMPDRYDAYIARKQTHLHKLAMVLSAARADDLLITKDLLIEADAYLTRIEASMNQVFSTVGAAKESKNMTLVLNVLRNYAPAYPDGITGKDLYTLVYNVMSRDDLKEAIVSAAEAQLISIQMNTKGVRVIVPST